MLKSIDKYGITEYNKLYLLGVFALIVAAIVLLAGGGLYYFEAGLVGANIKTFGDACWTVWMAMSTIGFGDFYPITIGGRIVIGSMFVVGAVNMGVIIGIVGNLISSKFDNSIANRELKRQLDITLMKLDRFEDHFNIDIEVKFGKNEHGIDIPKIQHEAAWGSKKAYVTMGQDDSGIWIVALNSFDEDTSEITLDKHTFVCQDKAFDFYKNH